MDATPAARNLTAERQATAELREAAERFRSIIESLTDVVYEWDLSDPASARAQGSSEVTRTGHEGAVRGCSVENSPCIAAGVLCNWIGLC